MATGRDRDASPYPVTPDGRYFLVRGRLWRMSDPSLAPDRRAALVSALMAARRAVGAARRSGDGDAEAGARQAVDRAKTALGERGPAWWSDGAPDLNRRLARTTPYADWFDRIRLTGTSEEALEKSPDRTIF
jgi:hypothetical protein